MSEKTETNEPEPPKNTWLPALNTPKYYVMLGAIALFILGPLGGITAIFMCFSLGFFVGGQVLAGLLGSTVTYGYGSEGKHGANYMQTMAASVAGMSAMGVLIQARVWLGVPEVPSWQLALYFMSIGMFGVGLGMLYTPILVDRMNLTFPSGLAVANILRALTDRKLLQQSIAKLGSGTGLGFIGGLLSGKLDSLASLGVSTSTIGAGMIVGARIAVPGVVVAVIGEELKPYLVSIGWLHEGEPFRKIGFILALGTILGAAAIDLSIIFYKVVSQLTSKKKVEDADAVPAEQWQQTSVWRLVAWVVFWGVAVFVIAVFMLHLEALYVGIALGLVLIFLLINGISTGISDSNPISSAFVVSVFVMAAAGLGSAATGLMCASIMLIATSVGVDMQQDRSTGKRLGTNRTIQFRYQVVGIVMGAVLAVVLAKLFMKAYPFLELNQVADQALRESADGKRFPSAMTFKFVAALQGITEHKPHIMKALWIGIGIGFVMELIRKIVKNLAAWKNWAKTSKAGYAADFAFDALIVPSPYASSFGGFVDLAVAMWFAVGGVMASFAQTVQEEAVAAKSAESAEGAPAEVPEDMSTTSLVGGGLIAGDALAALALGLAALGASLFR